MRPIAETLRSLRSQLGRRTLVMGILNATPDSFYDGGRYTTLQAALARAEQMIAEGADILDIGGESTRPGAEPVPLEEELERVIPLIHTIAQRYDIPISVDTTKSEVARQALAAGACIVNDISGMQFDPAMPEVVAEAPLDQFLQSRRARAIIADEAGLALVRGDEHGACARARLDHLAKRGRNREPVLRIDRDQRIAVEIGRAHWTRFPLPPPGCACAAGAPLLLHAVLDGNYPHFNGNLCH